MKGKYSGSYEEFVFKYSYEPSYNDCDPIFDDDYSESVKGVVDDELCSNLHSFKLYSIFYKHWDSRYRDWLKDGFNSCENKQLFLLETIKAIDNSHGFMGTVRKPGFMYKDYNSYGKRTLLVINEFNTYDVVENIIGCVDYDSDRIMDDIVKCYINNDIPRYRYHVVDYFVKKMISIGRIRLFLDQGFLVDMNNLSLCTVDLHSSFKDIIKVMRLLVTKKTGVGNDQ